eukprot:4424858-Prymnesium_polylepis.2
MSPQTSASAHATNARSAPHSAAHLSLATSTQAMQSERVENAWLPVSPEPGGLTSAGCRTPASCALLSAQHSSDAVSAPAKPSSTCEGRAIQGGPCQKPSRWRGLLRRARKRNASNGERPDKCAVSRCAPQSFEPEAQQRPRAPTLLCCPEQRRQAQVAALSRCQAKCTREQHPHLPVPLEADDTADLPSVATPRRRAPTPAQLPS